MHFRDNTGGLFPAVSDNPVQSSAGTLPHPVQDFATPDLGRPVEERFQKIAGCLYLTVFTCNLVKIGLGINAHSAEKEEGALVESFETL
jgi:hypothetical protein